VRSSDSLRVVGSRNVAELARSLARGQTVDEAVKSGSIARVKVVGRWIYAPSTEIIDKANGALRDAAEELLSDWFTAPLRILAASAAKQIEYPEVSSEAAESLMRRLVQTHSFNVVGLLTTKECEPYLAITSYADENELRRQLDFIESRLARGSAVRISDLPEPSSPRRLNAWRGSLLRHGEFLGFGAVVGDALVPWQQL
jgi:hypothetical protein